MAEIKYPNLLKAEYQGKLKIGKIPCSVLEDGTRVLRARGVATALGTKGSGTYWSTKRKASTKLLPEFISAKNLAPFVDDELLEEVKNPIIYKGKTGSAQAGLLAEILPKICEVWLKAKDANALISEAQEKVARQADILMRGLAKVGIIALVDEATGYQIDRQKDELQKILAAYISKELLPWQKRFPNEYYDQIFRLRNWRQDPLSQKRPQLIGKITNEVVYKLLPPGVLDELQKKNPVTEAGYRTYRHHQYLTINIGNPNLEKHLAQIIVLMRISKDWADFEDKLYEAFPIAAAQLKLELEESIKGDEKLHKFLREGGRGGATTDFNKVLKKAAKPATS